MGDTAFSPMRDCEEVNVCVPTNSCVETLAPSVMVLGGGVIGK